MKTLLLLIIFILSSAFPKQVISQSDNLEPIYSGGYPLNLSWSIDSQEIMFSIIYANVVSDSEDNRDWFKYELTSSTLTNHPLWLFQPEISQSEIDLMAIAQEETPFMFMSPNERYIVYPTEPERYPTSSRYYIYLLDRQTNQIIHTGDYVNQPFVGVDYFNVRWSNDSSAYVATTARGGNRHITNYDSSPQITHLAILELQNATYYPREVYDLSNDGKYVLLRARVHDEFINTFDETMVLLVIDTENIEDSIIIDTFSAKGVIGATFVEATDDSMRILLINGEGLIRYNVSTQEMEILDNEIHSTEGNHAFPERALFSPDRQSMVWVKVNPDTSWSTYVINVEKYTGILSTAE